MDCGLNALRLRAEDEAAFGAVALDELVGVEEVGGGQDPGLAEEALRACRGGCVRLPCSRVSALAASGATTLTAVPGRAAAMLASVASSASGGSRVRLISRRPWGAAAAAGVPARMFLFGGVFGSGHVCSQDYGLPVHAR